MSADDDDFPGGHPLPPPSSKVDKTADVAAPFDDETSPATRAFYGHFLILAGLPYSDPGPLPEWTRRSGSSLLRLQPGLNVHPDTMDQLQDGGHCRLPRSAYPYGINPRYLFAWLATEARKKHSRTLYTGDSMSAFMAKMGLACTGGVRGSLRYFTDQFWRLATCSITSYRVSSDGKRTTAETFHIADKITLWGEQLTTKSPTLARTEVVLSQRCYDEFCTHSVPYNPLALRAFTGSAFQFDIYLWLTYRMYYLTTPTRVTWTQLQGQFGSTVTVLWQFRQNFLHALAYVRHVYPQANLTVTKEGIILRPSPPHVPIVR